MAASSPPPGIDNPSGVELPPLLAADALRAAGRQLPLPLRVALADGRQMVMHRLLRVLPGKRLVGEADLAGRRVLAKLFIGARSEKHWQRERRGVEALLAAGVATPALLAAMPLAGGGHALLTDFLAPAESLAEAWDRLVERAPGDSAARRLLADVLALTGRLHAAGLVQDDLHFGNFLRHDGTLFLIDGDTVRAANPAPAAADNLAVLLAQLPPDWDAHWPALLAAYAEGAARPVADLPVLQRRVAKVRAWRLADFLGKTLRDCTLFAVEKRGDRFSAVVRREAAALAPLLAAPEVFARAGSPRQERLGESVVDITLAERRLTLTCYAPPDYRQALCDWLGHRPARLAWRAGHRLRFLGIPTMAPLALVEENGGAGQRRAWLIHEHCPGPTLRQHLASDRPPAAEDARALLAVCAALRRHRLSHGRLSADNLHWHAGQVVLTDLVAMVQHRLPQLYARAWRRDRAELLASWPAGCALRCWLDARLPAA